MKQIKGSNALLTGASRGLGVAIAKRLAEEGVNLVLAARSIDGLNRVREEVESMGVRSAVVQTDLMCRTSLKQLVQRAENEFGPIDLLINNAAVEVTAAFETLSLEEIETLITVNLTAPTILSRLVFPPMLKRNRGHIVNISSIEGLIPFAFEEVYTATKYGLVGLTMALRAACRITGSSVSASVVCPGAIRGTGMFHRNATASGIQIPNFLIGGTTTTVQVAEAVVRDIKNDSTGTIVNKGPVRVLHAMGIVAPKLMEWLACQSGLHNTSRQIAVAKGRGGNST